MTIIRLEERQFTDPPKEPWFTELLNRINEIEARRLVAPVEGILELSLGDEVSAHQLDVTFPRVTNPQRVTIDRSDEEVTGFKWRAIGEGKVRINLMTAGAVVLRAQA